MAFLEFIERLQKKPEAERKRIAVIVVFMVMAVIVAVWFAAFNLRQKDIGSSVEIKKPFESLKEEVSNFYGFFKKTIRQSE